MFATFLDDLELFLPSKIYAGLTLMNLCIIVLFFADDMVLVGNSVQDLQNSLNQLYDYCQYWGLEVNTEQTMIEVFLKRGPALPSEHLYYNNEL